MARTIINLILWHPEIQISETQITYIHRGVQGNLKKISGESIERVDRGFLILKEGTQIPFHRIIKIENNDKVLWKR
jgi:uncharacterized protein